MVSKDFQHFLMESHVRIRCDHVNRLLYDRKSIITSVSYKEPRGDSKCVFLFSVETLKQSNKSSVIARAYLARLHEKRVISSIRNYGETFETE